MIDDATGAGICWNTQRPQGGGKTWQRGKNYLFWHISYFFLQPGNKTELNSLTSVIYSPRCYSNYSLNTAERSVAVIMITNAARTCGRRAPGAAAPLTPSGSAPVWKLLNVSNLFIWHLIADILAYLIACHANVTAQINKRTKQVCTQPVYLALWSTRCFKTIYSLLLYLYIFLKYIQAYEMTFAFTSMCYDCVNRSPGRPTVLSDRLGRP